MNNFFTVLWHTYFTKLKSKIFIITTAVILGLILIVSNLQGIVDTFSSNDDTEVLVIDESSEVTEALTERFTDIDGFELTIYDGSLDAAKAEITEDNYSGLIVIENDAEGYPTGHFYANQISENWDYYEFETELQEIKNSMIMQEMGLKEPDIVKLNTPIEFSTDSLAEGAKTDKEADQARVLTYILIFVLYMTIIMYGNMIATDVATEKSSRVMELIISSVAPPAHMFGKIFGVALLGLTQAFVFMIFFLLTKNIGKSTTEDDLIKEFIGQGSPMTTIIFAIVFFILGYFLYGTLAAMLGSIVSRVEDVQMLMTPMILLIVAALIIAMIGLAEPSSIFITICSFIPFFTPMIMFLRVSMLNVPIWEVSLSIGILIGTIILLGVIGSRIYRGGVLLYGPSRSLKDLWKIFQTTKKER